MRGRGAHREQTLPRRLPCRSILGTVNGPSGSPVATAIVVRLGEDLVRITAPAERLEEIARMLADEIVVDPTRVDVQFAVDDSGEIRVDGRQWEPDGDLSLCDNVMYALMRIALDREAALLHLHAGLVGVAGRSLVIAGLAGSGKSTLVADLVAGGMQYFTDERVGVDEQLGLSALRKPISVVAGSFAHLAAWNPARTQRGTASDRIWHLPASAIAAASPGAPDRPSGRPPALAGIVFTEFRAGAAPTLEAMHAATAARHLLSDALDVDRYGPGALALAARLCASVPCWSMVHGGGGPAVDAVRSAALATYQRPAVRAIAPGSRSAWKRPITVTASSALGVAARTSGACIGERALLRTESGDLVELDEVLTAWLLLLDGSTTVGALVGEVAAANQLDPSALMATVTASLAHLARLGVAA